MFTLTVKLKGTKDAKTIIRTRVAESEEVEAVSELPQLLLTLQSLTLVNLILVQLELSVSELKTATGVPVQMVGQAMTVPPLICANSLSHVRMAPFAKTLKITKATTVLVHQLGQVNTVPKKSQLLHRLLQPLHLPLLLYDY